MDHVRRLLVFHVINIVPELGNKIISQSYNEALLTCHQWTDRRPRNNNSSNSAEVSNSTVCNFCKIKGHKEADCRKKAKQAKVQVKAVSSKAVQGFQLDTGADAHVTGSVENLSDYSPSTSYVNVVSGLNVRSLGRGNLLMPSIDGKTEALPGAVLIPGENNLVSLEQLEKLGYTLKWSNTGPIQLLRRDGTTCAAFHREGGRLIWRATRINAMSSKRNWHVVLGHPGPKALSKALQIAGIHGYNPPALCAVCTGAKMTAARGHSSLRSTLIFAEHLHADLVGGSRSLSLADSTEGPQWFLLVVDEATAWKWAWPIQSKKEVVGVIRSLLQELRNTRGITPKRFHCDSGTEFLNEGLRSILQEKGITLSYAAAKAHEQNGIVERNVRTVTEKMRALHL